MDQSTREFVLNIIGNAKDLTLATVRPDGYPQATTVSYANDGLTLYVGIGKDSQKADNIRHNNKVSLTINTDYQDWSHIKGLPMGGRCRDCERFRETQACNRLHAQAVSTSGRMGGIWAGERCRVFKN